ncbi:hypothetical protein G7Z17_g1497 [Cylindrodendrum hubeiense]|uniref:Uncharacterized protein n=1 Tax=Cylindrodendrum hubeiense TaxID=595255 RepID=A0A9P5LCG0_9HYPO|nr:hypothetical protein G7Z17_g1497 [Cylindrodendrum hubeiense]
MSSSSEKPQSRLVKTSSTPSINSEFDSPPAYDDAAPAYEAAAGSYPASGSTSTNTFTATSQFQVQAIGYDLDQALTGMTLENIPVYNVGTGEIDYTSIRLKRNSNSCALVRGCNPNGTPLIATVYRWGPLRHPRMRILPPNTSISVEEAINTDQDKVECELVEVRNRSIISRTQRMETSFGTFEWRYGSRTERRDAYDAASLMIMERTDPVSSAGGKSDKKPVRVAQLVRNDEFRTPGTIKYMGGNGGRLMMNLDMWLDEKKASAKDVEAFVVASCICMLKREADRFRDNQISIVV